MHELIRACVLVLVVTGVTVALSVGTQARPTQTTPGAVAQPHAALDDGGGLPQFQPPNMTATTSSGGPNEFTVRIRNAAPGQTASVDVPSGTGETDTNGELEGLTVRAREGPQSYSFDVSVAETPDNLTTEAAGALPIPSAFDSALVFVDPDHDEQVDLTYSFDVDQELLTERGVPTEALIVTTYRGGEWTRVDDTSVSRSGGEFIVDASVAPSDPLALGLQHGNLTVTNVSRHEPPLLSNRTSQLAVTVANNGQRAGSETFVVETDDDRILQNTTVSVPVGETRTVPVPVQFVRSGNRSVEVGEFETWLPVREPQANISVARLGVTRDRLQVGETATVEATLHNTGRADGTIDVPFRAFGDVVDTRAVSVPAGGSRSVTFEQSIDAPGEYELGVGNATTTVTVEPSATGTTSPPSTDERVTTTDPATSAGGPVGLLLTAVGATVALLFTVALGGRLMTGT